MRTTADDTKAALAMTFAVAEAIREAGSIPSGELYATLMAKINLEGYNKLIGILKGAGLVSEDRAHRLSWVGPNQVAK